MLKATNDADWTDPCFVEAGKKVKELVDKQPFQEGFLAANWDGAGGSAATMALEKSAMLLQGQWAPGTSRRTRPTRRRSTGNLGWFPFPTVSGGKGAATDGVGGGNGIAVGKNAPPEAIDFLKYFSEKPQADRWGALNTGILPVTVGSESSVTDPQLTVRRSMPGPRQTMSSSTSTRPPRRSSGNVINDAIATLFAGTGHA